MNRQTPVSVIAHYNNVPIISAGIIKKGEGDAQEQLYLCYPPYLRFREGG